MKLRMLIQNESRKLLSLKMILLLLAIAIVLPIIFNMNKMTAQENNQDISYQNELKFWLEMADSSIEQSGDIAPYQKQVFDEYRELVSSREERMEEKEEAVNQVSLQNLQSFLTSAKYLKIVFFFLTICLVSIIFAGEFSNGTISQTLLTPCKREKILLAKWLTVALILFGAYTYCLGIVYLMEKLFYPCSYHIPYMYISNDQVKELPFIQYYLGIFALNYLQVIILMIASTSVAVITRKKLTTLVGVSLIMIISMFLEKLFHLAGKTWYNFLPSFSFNLEERIFTFPIINEVEEYNSKILDIVNMDYGNVFLVTYNAIVIGLLLLCARDAFVRKDVK